VREWNDGAGLKSELDFLRSLAEILAPLDGGPADVKRALDAISVMRIALSAPRSSSAATKFPSVVYQLHDWCNRDFTGKDVIEDAQDLMEEAAEVIKRLSTVSATGDMERDAKRYRWLKATHFQTGVDSWIRTGDDLEEAIDAAMDRTSHACPYCTSDNPAIRSTYYDQTCEGCVKRMGRG
jgi:hypothetical protein